MAGPCGPRQIAVRYWLIKKNTMTNFIKFVECKSLEQRKLYHGTYLSQIKKDCAVRALVNYTGIRYRHAFERLERAMSRTKYKHLKYGIEVGTTNEVLHNTCLSLGMKLIRAIDLDDEPIKVNEIGQMYSGIMTVPGHATTVLNSRNIDMEDHRRSIISNIWTYDEI